MTGSSKQPGRRESPTGRIRWDGGIVAARYKYVRADFLTAVLESGSHWLRRPVLPNRLADGADLFARAP